MTYLYRYYVSIRDWKCLNQTVPKLQADRVSVASRAMGVHFELKKQYTKIKFFMRIDKNTIKTLQLLKIKCV